MCSMRRLLTVMMGIAVGWALVGSTAAWAADPEEVQRLAKALATLPKEQRQAVAEALSV